MNKNCFDVVIVGSGAAGCVVADYLATNTQASIAVLEAGKTDLDPMIHIPAGYSEILAKDKHVWLYETVPQHGNVQKFRMGKVVGGGTSINAMCYVRGQRRDIDTWQQSVNDEEWSYDSLWKTFIEQENNDTFHNKTHGISGNLSVQLPHGINKSNQYCMKAFQEFGLPYNPDYNG
ncbi:GMC family oxidoreductase N-terminal domain-containing protein, partial [Serratia marcescens]